MTKNPLSQVVIAGIGHSGFYSRGKSPDPDFKLILKAIFAACQDAGVSPKEIDGLSSYCGPPTDPRRVAAALGLAELKFAGLQWSAGGGGTAAAFANAAAAIISGYCDCVAVIRSVKMDEATRYGQGYQKSDQAGTSGYGFQGVDKAPYGVMSPASTLSFQANRLVEMHGVPREVFSAVSRASYHHAQNNPDALMRGRPLSEEAYDNARWIAEPYKLYDCCLENDGACAVLMTRSDRAKDLKSKPVHILSVGESASHRADAPAFNWPDFCSSGFRALAPRLYRQAGVSPKDIDVVQVYENFIPGVVMALEEFGLCTYENAKDVLRFENLIAPSGRLPLNTSGGNLAEAYVLGMGNAIEGVRQLRGESCNQVPNAKVCLVTGGPLTPMTSAMILGQEAAA
jgi:acetyl-CoA acetyltransferase